MSVSRVPLPDSYEEILSRAQLAQQEGDVQAAEELYRRVAERLGRLNDRILTRRPDLRDLRLHANLELVDLLRGERRFAEAIEVEEGVLAAYPEKSWHWRRDLALLRVYKGEVDRGLQELTALAEEEPGDVWTWLILSQETRLEGRYAESGQALGRAEVAAQQTDDGKAVGNIHFGRFLLYEAMGQVDQAVDAWEQAVAAQPEIEQSARQVVTLLTNAGRYTEAQRYVARDSNKLQAGFQRGLLAQMTGDGATARKEWQAVAEMDPAEFEYGHDCWVEAVLRLGDPAPALQELPPILSEHATVRLLTLSGIAWAMHGDRQRAQTLLDETIRELRRGRQPKQKLDSADWRLFTLLVADEEMRTALKPYFAVVDTIWG
jgi:tetratricopeptide (TPR) repeat protein